MMRILIVDDEKPARDRLRRLLSQHDDVEIAGEADQGLMALDEIERLKPDLVFLDIEMPVLDGIGTAEALGQLAEERRPSIVFATAYNDYALKAFEVSATDYLMKPINETRLAGALAKIRRRAGNPKPANASHKALFSTLETDHPRSRMAVRIGAKYVIIDLENVTAVLARDHYAAILVDGRELFADDSLDSFARRLNPNRFMRVHRGAIVNLDCVKELEREGDRKFSAILNDAAKTRIPISRDRLDELRQRFGVD